MAKNLKPHLSDVHPNHNLIHTTNDQANYHCDACKTTGSGDRFQCHVCVADIHVYCANCPRQLSSFLHAHPLSLILTNHHRTIFCDICRESIDGVYYRCSHCDFDVHPLCTQLPDNLRHVIDHHHPLRLHKLSVGSCSICRTDCSSLWVYGCDVCRVNIHLKCLFNPYGSEGRSRGPPAEQASFHGGNNYYNYGYGLFPNYDPRYYYYYHYGPGQFEHNNPSHHHRPNHGGGDEHEPPSPSPSSTSKWGLMLGSSMFSLIGNIAAGAINGFIFGSF